MHGFQPGAARKALQAARGARQHKADGGLIRGPGTGTSDSIEDTVPAGTYIMPSDSVGKVGEEALAGMGARGFKPKSQRKGVDVRLSNGEYELPPEQVHAVGVQALDALKNATHEQVGEGLGVGPDSASEAMFFADGGLVSREGNSYSGGNVVGQISINGGAPGGTVSSIGGPVAAASPAAVPAIPETSVRMLPAAAPAPAPGLGIIDSGAQRQQFLDRAASATEASRAARPMGSPVASVPGTPQPPGGFGSTSRMGASRPGAPGAVDQSSEDGFGFMPRGYANGGVVAEETRRRASSFGDAAAAARDSSVVQLGAPRPATASTGSRDLGASIPAPLPMLTPSLPPSPQAQQMAGYGAPSATPAAPGAPAAAPSASPLDTDPRVRSDRTAIGGAWDRVKDVNDRVSRGIMDATTYPARMALTAYDNTVVRGMRAGGLDVAPLAPALAPQGTDPSSFAPFSDQKPGLGFGPTARANAATQSQVRALDNNPANASAIAAVGAAPNASPVSNLPVVAPAPAAAAVADAPGAPGGFAPTAGSRPVAGSLEDANAQAANLRAFNASVPVGGLTVIGNPGPAAAQAMFDQADLRTAAARGSWSPRRGFQSDQGAIAAAAVPVQNRQQAELEAGRQTADTQRASLGFQSAAQREAAAARLQSERIAAEDRRAADTNSIRREEVAGANRLRDTQVAAAQDEAALRRIVLDPKTSVSERARAQQGLLAMQGKVAGGEWKPVALQGSTDANGYKTEGVLAAVNSATGEVRRLDQGQSAAAAKFEKGAIYVDGQGRRARYTGNGWEPA